MGINPDFFSPRSDVSEHLTAFIDEALIKNARTKPVRMYLGGSWIGHECPRRVALTWASPKGAVEDGRVQRIFDVGHAGEKRMAGYLRLAGYDLLTEDEDGHQFSFTEGGQQFCFADYGGHFRGSEDGIVMGGPGGFKFPMTWGHKTANDDKFRAFQRHGVLATAPIYYGQTQIYMHKIKPHVRGRTLDLRRNPSLFTVENKNTQELYAELIYYNPFVAEELDKRARVLLQVLPAGREHADEEIEEALPFFKKISENRRNTSCSKCPFSEKCHGPSPLKAFPGLVPEPQIDDFFARQPSALENLADR